MQIYLDNAATSYPKPLIVRKTVTQSLVNYGANPGRSSYKMASESAKAVYNVRKKVSQFFLANGEEKVVFTKNCTESINMVLFGSLKKGDHVVISDLEHNAVMRAVHALSKKGVEYSIFETFPLNDDATLNSLREKIKPNTKLMVCTAGSNVFGFVLPFARLCALCHLYDIKTCVDAAQTAGVLPINMEKDMIDFLCVPSHKGLYGIMGAGILICQKDLESFTFGGTGTGSFDFNMPEDFPEKMESGTLPLPAILSIGAGIDFLNQNNKDKIYKDEMNKISFLQSELKKNEKVILYTEEVKLNEFLPVLSFNIKGENCGKVGDFLASKGICVRSGIHCAPLAHKKMNTFDGTVRVSPCAFNTENDIKNLILTIKKL